VDRFRLVVGVDGSAAAREALRWASRFATVLGGEIVVAHALGPGQPGDGDDPALVEKRRAEIADVVETEWCAALRGDGPPFHVVVRRAEAVDLLVGLALGVDAGGPRPLAVLGNAGLGDGGRLDLGGTCRGLLGARRLPVLVVTGRDQAAAHLALRRILVGVDDRPAADAALEVACAVARGFRSWVHVVHAAEEGDGGAAARADELRQRVAGMDLPVHVSVERGEPAEVIRAAVARADADLVVVGSNDRGDAPHAVHPSAPSVSRQVVRSVQRPTLVVPHDGPAGSSPDGL
jgi:nucleotide-binding universal stress UspA family protein